ncbi:MAG: hypothetical protein Kow00107_04310 [Planctomycetota bacterium]
MRLTVALFSLLFVFFAVLTVNAELKIGDPATSLDETYKLIYSKVHCGWLKITTKVSAGVLTYDQEMEIGPLSESITIKARNSGLQAVVVNTKLEKEVGKIVALLEDKPKKFKGSWGKDKREYSLDQTSFLPARAERFAALPEIGWAEDKEISILDLTKSELLSAKPTKSTEDDKTFVKTQGQVVLTKNGTVEKIVLSLPFGEVTALPCEAKEMKPSNQKEVDAMFDEKVFYEINNGYFDIKGYGTVEFSFLYDAAPKHCARIRHLIEIKYYEGKTFHRLAPLEGGGKGRILQGGSSDGKGFAGCPDGKTVPLEAKAKHDKGTIGMARTQDPNSANAQFYFNLDSVHGLDGNYTVWGKVEKGMDVLEKIWADNFKGPHDSTPKNTVVIEKCGFKSK